MDDFRLLPGLPGHGSAAIGFPAGWGHGVREGLVVAFRPAAAPEWVGNFAPGLGGIDDVRPHPNGEAILVISRGLMFYVDPAARTATELGEPIFGLWPVPTATDLILSRQDIAFLRIGSGGVVWHTRRVSWDGFRNIQVGPSSMKGEAWTPIGDCWLPFTVDLQTGLTEGGSYNGPEEQGWEQLAP